MAEQLHTALMQTATHPMPTIILADLNCPNINWQTHSHINSTIDDIFVEFMVDHGFTQFVTEPTRCNNVLMMMMMKLPILPCAEKLELVLSTAPKT